jgi:hypothetical protein
VSRILYLHGFCSAPSSHKARKISARLEAMGMGDRFWCEQLPPSPAAVVSLVEAAIQSSEPLPTLVGSSLGGYYATYLAERHGLRAALINPAVLAPLTLAEYLGPQTNLYTGEVFEFTPSHLAELRTLEIPRITRPERYLLIVGTADELLDHRHAVSKYAGAEQILVEGGDHGLTDFEHHVDAVLRFAGLSGVG